MSLSKVYPAVVLGMSETGLGIVKSLSSQKIKVLGIDHGPQSGTYSNKLECHILIHPSKNSTLFKSQLMDLISTLNEKPVLFVAGDEYLSAYITDKAFFDDNFYHSLPDSNLLEKLQDKMGQYKLVRRLKIPVPKTLEFVDDVEKVLSEELRYPLFVKGREVNSWRAKMGSSIKGIKVLNELELNNILIKFKKMNIPIIIQEIVQGTDRDNFKVCSYINKKLHISFEMAKIHQYPIGFGIGSSAISVSNEELRSLGSKLFKGLNYNGIASAEFKFDNIDKCFKLIEINTRYWQQNTLADFCGLNFPLIDYAYSTGQELKFSKSYHSGRKWVNLALSFESFLQYRKRGSLTFSNWISDIRGVARYSYLDYDDLLPFIVYASRFFKSKLVRLIKGSK